MENCNLINAGYGSSLTLNGDIECEASLLNVNTKQWSTVSCINKCINPIKAAEALLIKSNKILSFGRIPPIFLVGNDAEKWCQNNGIQLCNKNHLRTKEVYLKWKKHIKMIQDNNNNNEYTLNDHGTCGAIGYDIKNNIMYVGTSSGGIWMKNPGRIGPSSIIGSGFDGITYNINNDTQIIVGCCCTGSGEYIMRETFANKICNNIIMDKIKYESNDNYLVNNVETIYEQSINKTMKSFNNKYKNALINVCVGCICMIIERNIKTNSINIHTLFSHDSPNMGISILNKKIKTIISQNDFINFDNNDNKNKVIIGSYSRYN